MKIMQVIPNFGYGGAEVMCANLAIELKKMGHDVLVVSLYSLKTSIVDEMVGKGVRFVTLGKKGGIDFSFFLKLARIIHKEKPDVVHSHLYATKYAQFLASIFGVKTKVFTIHNEASKDGTGIDHCLNRFLLKFCNVIPVTLSNDLIESSCKVYGPRLRQMPVVFNGIPLDKCQPVVGYAKEAKKFLHVGRFMTAKNHKKLIEGFVEAKKTCTNIELFMYGEGPLQSEIMQLVEKYEASPYIHYCGISSDIYSVMHEMDVFLLPSLWEGFPMTLVEAMGTGLPIIASNVGGIPNMLKNDHSALLIEPNSESISESIVTMCSDSSLREKLGRNALEDSAKFSSKGMALSYLNVYGECKWNR